MYLLILESIGTSELILIGIIALIIFGPRKLPQIAKTIGKTMADFRQTTNEFKTTWEKEVNFEDLENKINTPDRGYDAVENNFIENGTAQKSLITTPEIKEISSSQMEELIARKNKATLDAERKPKEVKLGDKQSWL